MAISGTVGSHSARVRFPRNWPFLTIGLLTFGLFWFVELAGAGFREISLGQGLVDVLRILIIPLWLMRYLEMFVGMGHWPVVLQLLVALPLLFVPYVVLDLLMREICEVRSVGKMPSVRSTGSR